MSKEGAWGTPDGEFNWCELDYQLTEFVAEPLNTATGTLYILVSLAAWCLHREHFKLEKRLFINLIFVSLIGIGTILFHGSLRYRMQLLDELPMYYLILLAAWGLYERELHPKHGVWLPAILIAWAFLISCVLQTTPKHSEVHHAFRGLMTCSFSVCFVYIFWAAATVAKGSELMQSFFSNGFLAFVIAIVCWLADNTICDVLQSFRWYPNLHAWGWHLGTSIGLYMMFLAILVHRQQVAGNNVREVYLYGCIPILRPAQVAKHKQG